MKKKSKGRRSKGVRLRRMSQEERLLIAIYGGPDPDKCKTRAEREAVMFEIELDAVGTEIAGILRGYRKPRLFHPQSSQCLSFRSMLDFQSSEKWRDKARYQAENVLFMLAQLARQIRSYALEDILRLRIECALSWSFSNAEADRLAARFAYCWNFVMSEYEILDDKERVNISVRPLRKEADSAEDENPYRTPGMTPEEITAAERKFALERLHRRLPDYVDSVGKLRGIVSRAADQLAAGEPFDGTMDEIFSNLRALRDVLVAETDIYYEIHNDTEYKSDDSLVETHERTDETAARETLVAEFDRFFDVATAVARRIGSKTASEFVAVKAILDSRKGDFSAPEVDEYCAYSRYLNESERLKIRNDLRRFFVGFHETYQTFHRHFAAAKLGGEDPASVKIAGFTDEGREEVERLKRAKPAEQDFFSDPNLRILFEVSQNTPANWRRGRAKPPEGFLDALARHDRKALLECAERYKASRAKADIMNTKGRVRRNPEELS